MSNLVDIVVEEIALFIEMRMAQCTSTNHAIWNTSTCLHDETKHLVVSLPGEHYPSSVELEQSHRCGPQIDIEIIGQTQNWTA